MTTHSYAQTIPQLYNQLLVKGMPVPKVLKIRDAYQFAMEHFSCRFQESGKTFLSHVVGTASILVSLDADVPLISSGLLHNVYENGDFGCSLQRVSSCKRGQISRALGRDVEEYVAAFRAMRWNPSTIPRIYQDLNRFDSIQRGAVLIRLADWLEHHLDLADCYRRKSVFKDTINKSCGGTIADIASKLGHPDLGLRILKAVEENDKSSRLFQDQTQSLSTMSAVTIPGSYHKRLSVVVCENVRSGLAYVRKWRTPGMPSTNPPQLLDQPRSVWGQISEGVSFIGHSYAQTSLQLFNQLRQSGYSQEELHGVQQSYQLAVTLTSGIYRPSWKSTISHFVGVSSILAAYGQPPHVVAAGVIHNAYKNGDFGTGRKGITKEKRKYVQNKLGFHVEEYLAGFAKLRWTLDSLPTVLTDILTLDDIHRTVVLIRLADHLERFLDHDILYCGEQEKQKYFDQTPQVLKVATALGHDLLASEIEKRVTEARQFKMPAKLPTGWNESYFVKPKSLSPRFGVAVRNRFKQGRRRLKSLLHH